MSTTPPQDPDVLRAEISARYGTLSKRLQQIARFALDHPEEMALNTIVAIAERSEVQPSALVRFAKAFGFSGFSEMQKVFRQILAKRPGSYAERIRLFRERQKHSPPLSAWDMLGESVVCNILSLEHLEDQVDQEQLERAVELLATQREIHVVGVRRSFPVATYMAYAFSHFERYVHLLSGVGGMLIEQAQAITAEDVLVAISSASYGQETSDVVAQASAKGVPIIAITDSPLSPIAGEATVCFEIHEAEISGFRSLTASMCLAQTLVLDLGMRLGGGVQAAQAAGGRGGSPFG